MTAPDPADQPLLDFALARAAAAAERLLEHLRRSAGKDHAEPDQRTALRDAAGAVTDAVGLVGELLELAGVEGPG